jgi:hypothetical protein
MLLLELKAGRTIDAVRKQVVINTLPTRRRGLTVNEHKFHIVVLYQIQAVLNFCFNAFYLKYPTSSLIYITLCPML